MAVKQREYLLSVDQFNQPQQVNDRTAVSLLLVRLILLQPGSDPLHPDMGVGIKNYRYSVNQLEELQQRITDQISTYLPEYSYADIRLVPNRADLLCNIEITIDDTMYIYDSTTAPVPIRIQDIVSN